MAFIPYVDESDADPPLKALYDQYRDRNGHIDNILRIHSLNPPTMKGHFDLYRGLMYGKSELSRVQRETLAVVVSSLNDCFY